MGINVELGDGGEGMGRREEMGKFSSRKGCLVCEHPSLNIAHGLGPANMFTIHQSEADITFSNSFLAFRRMRIFGSGAKWSLKPTVLI